MREVKSESSKKVETKEYKGKVAIECIVKSDRNKKREIKDYSGDAVLQRLGVFSAEDNDPVKNFKSLMNTMTTDNKEKYTSLQELVEGGNTNLSENVAEHVLAQYLYKLGEKVSADFFKTSIIFVRLYRDCLNEYGWGLLRKQRAVTLEEKKREFAKEPETAGYIPDMSNDFINRFLPQEYPVFDKYLATELVRHLCDWVFKSGYTEKTLMLL